MRMSKLEDRSRLRWFLIDDTQTPIDPGALHLTSVGVQDVLRIYEDEVRASGATKEVLNWQVIILDNFIRNFLPTHGMAIMSVSQNSFR